MDIKQIQAAIASMPNVPTKGGKQYTMVAQRIEAFRKAVGADAGIETDLVVDDGNRVLIKCSIKRSDGFTVATGYAEEIRNSTQINKGAAIENCETSAVGRALAALGLHGGEYASVQEIEKHGRNIEHSANRAENQDQQWQTYIEKYKTKINQATETWQLRKLNEQQSNKLTALRQYREDWADELKAYIAVRFEQLNQGDRTDAPF
jgi:hypothetical protein